MCADGSQTFHVSKVAVLSLPTPSHKSTLTFSNGSKSKDRQILDPVLNWSYVLSNECMSSISGSARKNGNQRYTVDLHAPDVSPATPKPRVKALNPKPKA